MATTRCVDDSTHRSPPSTLYERDIIEKDTILRLSVFGKSIVPRAAVRVSAETERYSPEFELGRAEGVGSRSWEHYASLASKTSYLPEIGPHKSIF